MATPKQEKLLKLIMENYGELGSTKSLGELMLEAGYTEASAKNPKLILEGKEMQDGISNVVSDLELLRNNALNELKARDLEKEPMRDVVKAIDTYTKNHQLLTGGKTESNEMVISWKS